jgi:hypothetical protein
LVYFRDGLDQPFTRSDDWKTADQIGFSAHLYNSKKIFCQIGSDEIIEKLLYMWSNPSLFI